MKEIKSALLGTTDYLEDTDLQYDVLNEDIKKYPVNAFQMLNRVFNERELCLSIEKIGERE